MTVSREMLEASRRERAARANGAPARRVAFTRGDDAEVADRLLDALTATRAHVVHADGAFWLYEPRTGIWERQRTEALQRIVKSFAGAALGKSKVLSISSGAVEGAIRLARAEVADPAYFDDAEPGAAFADTVISVGPTGIIRRAHAPENRVRHGFAFAYDPDAPHPKLDAFLAEVFADAEDGADRTALLQEFTGACLVGVVKSYSQCLTLYGAGGGGKSEFMRIVRALFTDKAAVTIPPQQWNERFSVARLAGAAVNLVDEMPEAEFIETERFKGIVAGTMPIPAEEKFKPTFEFRARAGHIFACNKLPATADVTEAFFRRFLICPFTRRMHADPARRLDAGAEVVAAELPGVASWAVAGAVRLAARGSYTIPPSHKAAVDTWRRTADNVAGFIDEKTSPRVGPDTSAGTKAVLLYSAYRSWAIQTGHKPVSNKTFAHRMEALGLAGVRLGGGVYYPVVVPFGDEPM